MRSEPCGRDLILLPPLRGSRRAPRNRSRFALASRPAWWSSATSAARVRCGSMLLVGDTPNIAARLLALAEPGTIVVAASTRRLLGDLFRLRDLGRHEVKGIAEPVAAWAVEGISDFREPLRGGPRGGTDRSHRPRGRDRFPAGTPTPRLEGRRADRVDLGRAGDRQIPPCCGSRRAHRRRAVHALALPMLALPHQQRASSVHCPVGASSWVQGRRYVRATPRQAGSGSRHGHIAGTNHSAAFCCASVDPIWRALSAAGAEPRRSSAAERSRRYSISSRVSPVSNQFYSCSRMRSGRMPPLSSYSI